MKRKISGMIAILMVATMICTPLKTFASLVLELNGSVEVTVSETEQAEVSFTAPCDGEYRFVSHTSDATVDPFVNILDSNDDFITSADDDNGDITGIVSANFYAAVELKKGEAIVLYCGAHSEDDTVTYGVDVKIGEHDHIYTNMTVVYPTCTSYGYTTEECKYCGDENIRDIVDELGHDFSIFVSEERGTCLEPGAKVYKCSRCDETYSEPTSKDSTNHENVVIDVEVPATCEFDGKTAGSHCTSCGTSVVAQETISALGHSYTVYVSGNEATCTIKGEAVYKCERCDAQETFTNEYNPDNHINTVDIPGKEATCTEDGRTAGGLCLSCGSQVVESETIPATGHSYGEWYLIGSNPAKHCSKCGQNYKLPFIDITKQTQYYDYVDYCYTNKYITGTSQTTFAPNNQITRAMLVTILYRMNGSPSVEGLSNPFSDVPNGKYYTNAAIWAYENGITTETKFNPNGNVTREQTAAFLYRYAKNILNEDVSEKNDITNYPDYNNVSEWAREPMSWANAKGMITGTQQGYLDSKNATKRIHATKIIYNFGVAYL